MIGLVLQSEKTTSAPREIFCVIEKNYRSRAIADDACRNVFTNAGARIELGPAIDWTTNPLPGDEEWHIEWSKFYFGLDLAFAYSETGDEKYAGAWRRLVEHWIAQVAVGTDSSDVAARRIQNWIYAWMIFARNQMRFSDDFIDRIGRSLTAQLDHLRNNLTAERNHRTLELYALFVASLALPQLDANAELRGFALEQLYENLLTDILPDGVHREQSTHYHLIVLRSFLGVMENARRFGLRLSDGFADRVEKACEFAMHIHRPDGQIPALSDSDTGSYQDLLGLAAAIYDRPDLLFAATQGSKGTPPAVRNTGFANGGYYIQRSDWTRDAKFLIFDCGPLGAGGHGHYDFLNVEISANGKPLIVDPGRFTYSEAGERNWRHYFKGTAAHNTVSIDRKDQIGYRRGKPKGRIPQGQMIERLSLDGLDILCGKFAGANYDTLHTRRIFFVHNSYWLIWDELRGTVPRRFDLRFHLTPAAWNHVLVGRNQLNSTVSTPDLALVFPPDENINIEPGWAAPEYGIKHRIPCVSIVAEKVAQKDFFTLIKPLAGFEKASSMRVSTHSAATVIDVTGEDFTDVLSFRLSGERLEIKKFERSEVRR